MSTRRDPRRARLKGRARRVLVRRNMETGHCPQLEAGIFCFIVGSNQKTGRLN
jgi:hypothetical protein